MRDLINWSETDEKSRHGLPLLRHQVAKSTWSSITAKSSGRRQRRGKPTRGTLCLKGYYGWDFINDTQILTPRLKTPMIRRQRGGKLEPVSWDEALNYVAERLSASKRSTVRMPSRRPAPRVVRVTKPTM
ncbi:formate dehydrogenase H [Escherichia coli]|nr:formate dehydrogenase H [Escherichia coli]